MLYVVFVQETNADEEQKLTTSDENLSEANTAMVQMWTRTSGQSQS